MKINTLIKTNILLITILSSCASIGDLFPVPFEWEDNYYIDEFHIIFRNNTRDSICLLPEHWPNQAGVINQASGIVFVVINEERYPMRQINTGYCTGSVSDCGFQVLPGESISANIPYSMFDIPRNLYSSDKKLEYQPLAFRC